ncbi:hypothetical protein Y032_0219g2461 [Ancylostoma ceylanicum]|uniref:Uncharacterized protein n=1 Tax=Ancylostoma ceylanicum TaxID=53326 RepID=A0A016SJE5_9BILA|nr:hypothetical protein Y032_0219g2461 [Ancylostoma ceylanicum]
MPPVGVVQAVGVVTFQVFEAEYERLFTFQTQLYTSKKSSSTADPVRVFRAVQLNYQEICFNFRPEFGLLPDTVPCSLDEIVERLGHKHSIQENI